MATQSPKSITRYPKDPYAPLRRPIEGSIYIQKLPTNRSSMSTPSLYTPSTSSVFSGIQPFQHSQPSQQPSIQQPSPQQQLPDMSSLLSQLQSSMSAPRSTSRASTPAPFSNISTSFFRPASSYFNLRTRTYDLPEFSPLPQQTIPQLDQSRIQELTALSQRTPMSQLQTGLQTGMAETRDIENPMIQSLQREQLLSGYGTGLSNIATGARSQALQQYMPQYQAELQKAASEYQAQVQRQRDEFTRDMEEYLRKGTKVQASGKYYPGTKLNTLPYQARTNVF